MTLVLIEVATEAAIERLRLQEDIQVVGIVAKSVAKTASASIAPSPRKWAGSIPATSAEAWDKHLQEIRGEWERDI